MHAVRAAAWVAGDYAYAYRRRAAVVTAHRPRPAWLDGDPQLPEVVLVPGVNEHWTFLAPLGDALNRAGHRIHVIPGLGLNRRSISTTADHVARWLAVRPAPPAGRIIVAHSKGGLIGKQVLLDTARGRRLGVLGIVAVATPFIGSRRARAFIDPSLREFMPTNEAIVRLGDAATVNTRIVSIYGSFDAHVPDGSELAGALNLPVPAPGHFRVLAADTTLDAVLQGIGHLARTGRSGIVDAQGVGDVQDVGGVRDGRHPAGVSAHTPAGRVRPLASRR